MERNTLINIKNKFGGMDSHKNQLFLNVLAQYLECKTIDLLKNKYKKTLGYQYIRVTVQDSNTRYAHYIDNYFRVYFYDNKTKYDSYSAACQINFSVNELFGNCSTAVINNIDTTGVYGAAPEFYSLGLELAEDVADIFGYTCLTYTTSDDASANLKLKPYLAETFAIVDQYKNKRGGLITVFNKTI